MMNKKGWSWENVGKALVVITIVLILLYIGVKYTVNNVDSFSDCERSHGGKCLSVCPTQMVSTGWSCPKEDGERLICCKDEEAVRTGKNSTGDDDAGENNGCDDPNNLDCKLNT